MLRKLLITLGLFLFSGTMLFAQGTLRGSITDSTTKEPLPFVNVIVIQNGQQKGGGATDINGEYAIKPLTPGRYDIEVKYVGYKPIRITDVNVTASGYTVRNIQLTSTVIETEVVEIIADKIPLLTTGSPESGKRISGDDMARMPTNSIEGVVATVGGVGFNNGGTSTARGEEDMVTIQGGIRRRGSVNIPTEAVAEVQVILGGTPASIGEAIGGAQVLSLKPPATQFNGQVKYQTTQFLDNRGYNRLDVYLTGPLWTKTSSDGVKRTILGYRVNGYGSYTDQRAYRPDSRSFYTLKDDVRAGIENAPLKFDPANPTAVDYNVSYLTINDFEKVGKISNNWSASGFVNGALDIRFSENANLNLSAEYQYTKAMLPAYNNLVMNIDNTSQQENNELFLSADFTYRFPNDNDEKSFLKNVMYNISGAYQLVKSSTYTPDFKDDFFNYGYIGKFTTQKETFYALQRYTMPDGVETYAWVQRTAPTDVNVEYTPSTLNPYRASYASQLYANDEIRPNLTTLENIRNLGGLVNGENPPWVYSSNLFYAPGAITSLGTSYIASSYYHTSNYVKSQLDQYAFQARAGADIGNHSIEFGIQYEQLISRAYSLNANGLWTLMRQLANSHLTQLDVANPIIDYSGMYPVVSFNQLYDGASQSTFDINLRQKLGYSVSGLEWLDIDSYDPSIYSLDMFSATELFNSGRTYVLYNGYDQSGNIVSGKKSLKDFFNNDSRTLGAWNPIYMAGYIQDQFYFRDLIFNIGVRVDRFDGNQMVLKDPYLLYESYTVKEVSGTKNPNGFHPVGAQDDWVVYVNKYSGDESEINILGYRSGSTWYDAKGVEISDPYKIAGDLARPTPYRKDPNSTSSTEPDVNVFKEYDPQYVFMPRVAFSFPVSDISQFKASYDIIARRPGSGQWRANYIDYLYITDRTYLTNPNLKPEKITNYEIGFEQMLNKVSAISIAAYYKETRDLIQLTQYTGADPNPTYFSYDNYDFKTIKGVTIAYDLRRTKNITVNANYTLQYADGTELPTNTMTALIKEGYSNLKMLNPIWDDRRHEFKLVLDFRYAGGNKYNGPTTTRKVRDKEGNERSQTIKWLQNAGVNLVMVAQSGRPYTRSADNSLQTIVGTYYGSRLPWSFFINMEFSKFWNLKVGKKTTTLTAFARIQNLFNILNISNVYSVTGDPDDDGYLTDPTTQTTINSYANPQSFRDMYMLNLYNQSYGNYSTPRQVTLGVVYSF